MLYMIRKFILSEISFNILYNESENEYLKKMNAFIFTEFRIKYQSLKQRWRGMKEHCVVTHIYLSNKMLQIQINS